MYSHFSRAPRFSNGKKVSSFWEHAKPEILMFVILHPPMQKIFHSHMRQESLWATGRHEVIHHVQT
jgi:hypothetical protein